MPQRSFREQCHNKRSPMTRRSSMGDLDDLPVYDSHSGIGKKKIWRTRMAEKWVLAIPVVVLFCFFILWWFRHPGILLHNWILALQSFKIPFNSLLFELFPQMINLFSFQFWIFQVIFNSLLFGFLYLILFSEIVFLSNYWNTNCANQGRQNYSYASN